MTRLPLLIALCAASSLAGCGATCEELAVKRQTLVQTLVRSETGPDQRSDTGSEKPPPGPHARLIIPHARGNALLVRVLAELQDELAVALPPLGSLIPELGDSRLAPLQAVVTAVRLDAAPPGEVGISIDLELRSGADILASATAQVIVQPAVRYRGAHATAVEIAIPADSVQSIEPRIGVAGTRVMASRLHDRLPEAVRKRLPESAFRPLLARALDRVLVESYSLIQREVLGRLGEITRLSIQLPDLPIKRAAIHSSDQPPALVVDLFTTLPVRGTVASSAAPDGGIDPTMLGKIRLHLTGDIVTASANWAIDRRLAPTRYNRKLDPDLAGDYHPVFEWDLGSNRPLRIHVFRLASPCGYVLLAAHADLALRGDKVELVVSDRAIEKVEGSRILELGVWLDALWNRTFVKTKKQAAATCMTIGPKAVVTRVTDARLVGDQLTFGLDMAVEEAGAPVGPGGQRCGER